MNDRTYLLLLIFAVAGLLLLALKSGFIGGVGTGSYRAKNPMSYWAGVSVTAFAELMLVIALVSTFVR